LEASMTNPDAPRHVEVRDGDRTIAAAEVTTAKGAEGTARTWLHASSGHITPGSRASLVAAGMALRAGPASTRLEATVPLGDGEALDRLRERTKDAVTRPAGSTALLDTNIPPGGPTAAGGSGQGPRSPARPARLPCSPRTSRQAAGRQRASRQTAVSPGRDQRPVLRPRGQAPRGGATPRENRSGDCLRC